MKGREFIKSRAWWRERFKNWGEELMWIGVGVVWVGVVMGLGYAGNEVIESEVVFFFLLVVLMALGFMLGLVQVMIAVIFMTIMNVVLGRLLSSEQLLMAASFGWVVAGLRWLQEREWGALGREVGYFKKIANLSLSPIIVKDEGGKVKYASKSVEDLFGYKYKELLGSGLEDLVHPKDKDRFVEFYEKVRVNPGEKQRVEIRLKKRNGEWSWFGNEAVNLLHVKGLEGVVASFFDIDEQKALGKERLRSLKREQKARAEAEEALLMRDQFLSVASHELKTPLTTILLHLKATLRRIMTQSVADFSGEKLVKSLDVAEKQSQRLSMMIKDLLNVSLVSTGRIEIQKQVGVLEESLELLVKSFEERFAKAKTKLSLELKDKGEGEWDMIRIEQIVTNLLTNALKYGRGKPVKVVLKRMGNEMIVEVVDGGMGVGEGDLENIFELFHRGENGHRKKGLGVGLYISRQIARSHGGELEVESRINEGSIFRLRLPIEQSERENEDELG